MPIALFALLAVVLGVVGWLVVQRQGERSEQQRQDTARMAAQLREKVLSRKFDLARPDEAVGGTGGAIMDMPLVGGLATLVALDDDTVSVYLNPGGGVIGAGTHAAVATAGAEFRTVLAALKSRFSTATVFPAPAPGYVVFYLLTESATLSSGPLLEKEVTRDTHAFAQAYHSAHRVITAIRQAS